MAQLTKQQLVDLISTTPVDEIKRMAQAELQKLELVEKAAEGDDLSKTLLALKNVVDNFKMNAGVSTGVGVSKTEVEKMLKEVLSKSKITYDDLDIELRTKLAGQIKIELALTTPSTNLLIKSQTLLEEFERPLFQTILSDWKARNNVYLFGAAGTGKTYLAKNIAYFLGYKVIIVNCNQFTSPLDLLGGQTITGYQKGRLEMAWENVDEDGNKFDGAVLLLDELPKLDPNTAGILNEALASIKDFKGDNPPTIRNGKGVELKLANMFVIATGNIKLNETSVDYEANFKQDLSLQDRFVGSTYEISVDYYQEFNKMMKGFAFIWIYMTKVREIIIAERMTNLAFVSIRIMQSMRDTYIVYRDVEKQKINGSMSLIKPKTLKQSLDSFLNLFKPNQIQKIKNDSFYDAFLLVIDEKNKLPLNNLDTTSEINEANILIDKNKKELAKKIS